MKNPKELPIWTPNGYMWYQVEKVVTAAGFPQNLLGVLLNGPWRMWLSLTMTGLTYENGL